MRNHPLMAPTCIAGYSSDCGRFHAHYYPYGQTGYFTPLLIDDERLTMFQAVIPYERIAVVFVPSDKKSRQTSPFVTRATEIKNPGYGVTQLLADFAAAMGGAA